MNRRATVIVTSTRAAAGAYQDRTGPVIAEWLSEHGFEVAPIVVVADRPEVAAQLARTLASGPDLVVTTGGTGVGHGDGTADATAAVLDKTLPGFSEELRRRGFAATPLSLLSKGSSWYRRIDVHRQSAGVHGRGAGRTAAPRRGR